MTTRQGHRRSIYFSAEEYALIRTAAKKAGMSAGKYVQTAALVAALRGETPALRTTIAPV